MIRNPFSKLRDSEAVASVTSLLSSGSGISNPFDFKVEGFDFCSFDDLGENRRRSLEAVLRVVAFFSDLKEELGNRYCFHNYFFMIKEFLLDNGWSESEAKQLQFVNRSKRMSELAKTAAFIPSHEGSILKRMSERYGNNSVSSDEESVRKIEYKNSNCRCIDVLNCSLLGNTSIDVYVHDNADRVRTLNLHLFFDRELSDHVWMFIGSDYFSRVKRSEYKAGFYEGSKAFYVELSKYTGGRDGWDSVLSALNVGERVDKFCMTHQIDVANVQLELQYQDRLL